MYVLLFNHVPCIAGRAVGNESCSSACAEALNYLMVIDGRSINPQFTMSYHLAFRVRDMYNSQNSKYP